MGKVIFVMVDALGFDTAGRRGGYLEHLTEYRLAAKYRVRGELPSASRPMYETLMTGLPVSVHGIVTNQTSRRSRCENLFSLCKKSGKVTAAAAFLWISELYNGTCPFSIYEHRIQNGGGDIDHGIFYSDCDYPDTHLYADGEYLRKTYDPDFLLIHPMHTDTVGHPSGCASKEYQESADQSLQQVAILLERWREAGYDVIVTADTRGNYIEHMIKRCGGNALRVPDGFKAFAALKKIVQDNYEKDHSIAVALDGPLGPRHEPKKLAFYLSEHAEEDFVGISLSYSFCLRLSARWDKYVIPLPFTAVEVSVKNYGIVKKNEVPNLPVNADGVAAEREQTENERIEEAAWKQITY